MEKVHLTGTHRVRSPEETLEILVPRLAEFGLTRIADVTGLDSLGIPVAMAIRPLAATLSVSQGKGVSLALARVSAAMEAIELWHAERAVPAPAIEDAPAADLALGYEVTELEPPAGSLLTSHTRLDWIEASSALDGRAIPVPVDVIKMGGLVGGGRIPSLINPSSNGLASGNSRAEALVHALYEVIERDALGRRQRGRERYVELSSVPGYCGELIETIKRRGGWLLVSFVPNRFAVPCFEASLWREDMPLVAMGSGAHSDPEVALSRAITEAAQSRLTVISGTRDDISARSYDPVDGVAPSVPDGHVTDDWKSVIDGFPEPPRTDEEEAGLLARTIVTVAGLEPLVVDLRDEEIAVVRVLCPGLIGVGSRLAS